MVRSINAQKASTGFRACPGGAKGLRPPFQGRPAPFWPELPGKTQIWDFLALFQARVLLDQFFLAVARKAYGEFGLISGAFAAEHEAAAIPGMAHVGAGNEIGIRGEGLWGGFEFRVSGSNLGLGTWDLRPGTLVSGSRAAACGSVPSHLRRALAKEIFDRLDAWRSS